MKIPRIFHEPTALEFILIVTALAVLAVVGWEIVQNTKTNPYPHTQNSPQK